MTSRWDRGAVIYQIYPRSFCDSNGDGIGDLPGITSKLDYVASLGVDAIWISPFFRSPMKDFGYDVADPRDVDPIFGTLDDFDALVARAHELGLRVVIDQVLSHSSDEHPWFVESRRSREGPKSNWYVWADPREDGTPPNNWLSVFGGSAWQWEPRRAQYYLHNFLAAQPDYNLHDEAVASALLDDLRFWLDRGVDGFRFDAINFAFHDPLLRDNPPLPPERRRTDLTPLANPYSFQEHVYGANRPEVLGFLESIRAVLDEYDDVTSIGEIGGGDGVMLAREYTRAGRRLHMAYNFELLGPHGDAATIRARVQAQLEKIDDGWVCWSIGNHDVPRFRTRWRAESDAEVCAYLALSFCLRGAVCLYQGDELGLEEADVPYERIQDPYGLPFWPEFKGRDGCRTPMPWRANAPSAGFTTGSPWLPIFEPHRARAVDVEPAPLDFVKRFLAWRRARPELLDAPLEWVDAPDGVVVFTRGALWCAFNLGEVRVKLPLPGEDARAPGSASSDVLAPGAFALRSLTRAALPTMPRDR